MGKLRWFTAAMMFMFIGAGLGVGYEWYKAGTGAAVSTGIYLQIVNQMEDVLQPSLITLDEYAVSAKFGKPAYPFSDVTAAYQEIQYVYKTVSTLCPPPKYLEHHAKLVEALRLYEEAANNLASHGDPTQYLEADKQASKLLSQADRMLQTTK